MQSRQTGTRQLLQKKFRGWRSCLEQTFCALTTTCDRKSIIWITLWSFGSALISLLLRNISTRQVGHFRTPSYESSAHVKDRLVFCWLWSNTCRSRRNYLKHKMLFETWLPKVKWKTQAECAIIINDCSALTSQATALECSFDMENE